MGSDRQEMQREMLEKAEDMPGVAEAIEVYEAANGPLQAAFSVEPRVRYATGGNPKG